MLTKKSIPTINYFYYFLFIVIFIGVGFYFGYKNAEATFTDSDFIAEYQESLAQDSSKNTSSKDSDDSLEVIIPEDKELESNVVWMQINEEPICPPTHPIKGKFDNAANVYYTKENNFYNRVIPHICFASEEYAREVAGFIKKF